MNAADLSSLIATVTIIVTIAASIAVLSVLTRAMSIWSIKARASAGPPAQPFDADAIARLQASVDAISIEVERISEGQRFTTKLMNERIPERSFMPAVDDVSRIGQ
jgi:hypothetical protein